MCETRVYWLSIDVLVASGESLLVMIWVLLCLLAMVVCVCEVLIWKRETLSLVFEPYAKYCTLA
jgi:hypothetical protein